jgi:hypothetical protein
MRKQIPEGSIREYRTPSGLRRWRFTIDAPGPKGNRRQVKREGFATKAAARAALDELRRDLYEGKVPVPDSRSVEVFARSWIEALPAEGIEASTIKHYRNSIERLLPHVGKIKLQDLDEHDLDRAYAAIRELGKTARTIRASHVAARKMLDEARRLGR